MSDLIVDFPHPIRRSSRISISKKKVRFSPMTELQLFERHDAQDATSIWYSSDDQASHPTHPQEFRVRRRLRHDWTWKLYHTKNLEEDHVVQKSMHTCSYEWTSNSRLFRRTWSKPTCMCYVSIFRMECNESTRNRLIPISALDFSLEI